jgi:hypothetical protein
MSISAMKQALKFCGDIGDLDGPYPYVNGTSIVSDSRKVLPVLRQAIAEAEKQEPVEFPVVHAVRCTYPQCQATNGCVGVCSKGQPDLARVGEVGVWGDKREWVGLTNEEIVGLIAFEGASLADFVRAIEAKLKEKNT